MIGGHDISLLSDTPAQATEGTVRLALALWRDAVVEDAETGELLGSVIGTDRELPSEILIYRNAFARDCWVAHGAVPENASSMIHVVRDEDSVTVIVDDPDTQEMAALLEAVRDHVYQDIFWMRAGAA